jgi:hypothetical protein
MNTNDYRSAVNGEGPLAATWADKPHRLVYDLCGEIERLRMVAGERIEMSPAVVLAHMRAACSAAVELGVETVTDAQMVVDRSLPMVVMGHLIRP